MTKLPTPVEVCTLVYAEASKTVFVSFWTKFDKQAPFGGRQYACTVSCDAYKGAVSQKAK
jgi:hypothetical protein